MANRKSAGPAGPGEVKAAWFMPEQMVRVPIGELVPYARNARTHSESQIAQIRASLREFGFVNPVLIDSDRNIIAGHGRVLAAQAEGMTEVPCVLVEHLTDAQRRAYILADNRLAELSGWDTEMLALELSEMQSAGMDLTITGFTAADMEIEDPNEEPPAAEDDGDSGETDSDTPSRAQDGDVWKLGDHILLCGNCTEKPLLDEFLRGGVTEKVDLLLTDPPYNVALGMNEDEETARRRHRRTDGKIVSNDNMGESEFVEFLCAAFDGANQIMALGAAFYVWCASSSLSQFENAAAKVGWPIRQHLIWNKDVFVLSRQDYQWKHEPCLYGWKPGAAHKWCSDRSQTTVIDCPRPKANRDHPTMKPIPLFDYLIRNSTDVGDTVYDPFCGSGTTLLACEQANRKCVAVELSPRYCDVILRRWETLTGRKAERPRNLRE